MGYEQAEVSESRRPFRFGGARRYEASSVWATMMQPVVALEEKFQPKL